MYLFKDQIALMKISMIIPLDSIKYEVTCESSIEINVDMGIDTLLLKMADISELIYRWMMKPRMKRSPLAYLS